MSVHSKMTAIADAIREKTGGTNPLTLDQMATEIEGIQTGVQLPELNNPGSASDLAEGVELIDAEGKKVTGTVPVKTGLTFPLDGTEPIFGVAGSSSDGSCLVYVNGQEKEFLYRPSGMLAGMVIVRLPQTEMHQFGDATEADVTAGKTFTSAAGVKKTGTATGGEDPFETDAPFTYQVNSIDGADYGFAVNTDDYYESQNKGVNNSYAICRISLDVKRVCDITFDVINYAESNYDFALFSELDTALGMSYTADTNGVKESFNGRQSASIVNVVYADVPVGNHFIDIKFRKDQSEHSNYDSVQFKVQYDYSLPQSTIDKILKADEDLIAENIKNGVNIFGVVGNYDGFVLPTLTNPGTASDLPLGKQLIGADGSVIEGTAGASNNDYKAFLERATATPTFPSDLTKFGKAVCSYYSTLALTSLPETVTVFDNDSFAYCTNLALTHLPSKTKYINPGAFNGCSNLAITSIPSTVESIGNYAFQNCKGLTSITFEGVVKNFITATVFTGCTNLTTINVPWAEGEVANDPWGATNATINYNYTGG